MKKLALVLCVLLTAPLAMAGGIQKEQIPASVKWVAHADVEALLASQVGQFVLKQLKDAGIDAQLSHFIETFGFDPLKDIKSVTAFGTAFKDDSGVAMICGTFNKEKILGNLQNNATYKSGKYGGVDVHQWTDNNKTKYGCFVGADLAMIAGNEDLLKLAIDTLNKKQDSLAKGESALSLGKTPPGTWLVAAAADLPVNPDEKGSAAIVKKIQSARIHLGEGEKNVFAKAVLNTKSPKDANEISTMAQGLLAFAAMTGGDNGDGPKNPVMAKALTMLQQIQIVQDGATVTATAAWDTEDVLALIQQAIEMRKKAKTEGPAETPVKPRKPKAVE